MYEFIGFYEIIVILSFILLTWLTKEESVFACFFWAIFWPICWTVVLFYIGLALSQCMRRQ